MRALPSLEAEGLFFEPACGEYAVEEDGGSFVVAEAGVRVLGDDFAEDGDGVPIVEEAAEPAPRISMMGGLWIPITHRWDSRFL